MPCKSVCGHKGVLSSDTETYTLDCVATEIMHLVKACQHKCAHNQAQLPSCTIAMASVGTVQNDLQVLMLSMAGYTPVLHTGHGVVPWLPGTGAARCHEQQLVGVPGPGDELQGGWDHGGPGHAAAQGGGAAGQCLPCALLASPHGTGPVPVAASPVGSQPLSGSCLEISIRLKCM